MTTTLSIRLTSAVAAAIDAAAEAAMTSRSGWVRREIVQILLDRSRLNGSVRIPLPPSPPIRRHIPPEDLAAVSKLSADLSRAGGAVVQMTKTLRETGHRSHPDAEAVLSDLRQVQRQLSGLIATMSVAVVPVL